MLILNSESNDPYTNIATEEFLLKNYDTEVLFVYRNNPSVIVGKHQNAFKEVNRVFISEKPVAVVRRMSGGGTVYHDKGNLNISLISKRAKGDKLDISKQLSPIYNFLKTLHHDIKEGKRHEFRIDGKKISGTAVHIHKDKILCHATLLLNTNLNKLESAIAPPSETIKDKAINSVRSEVTNLLPYLNKKTNSNEVDKIEEQLVEYFLNNNWGSYFLELTEKQKLEINSLCKSKYKKWEWNFGYSPKFEITLPFVYKEMNFEMVLKIKGGKVSEIHSTPITVKAKHLERILRDLTLGEKYDYQIIFNKLQSITSKNYDLLLK